MKKRKITVKFSEVRIYQIAILILIALMVVMYFYGRKPVSLSKDVIGEKTISYINSHLVRPGTSAKLIGVRDLGYVYEVDTEYQGRNIPVYVSKDGEMIFLSAFNMTESESVQQPQAPKIPKRDKPDVKLFVMSYCPFGLQAEKAMLPVMKLLGSKANIIIHFVSYTMHGKKELEENLRQYCIEHEQNDKYYDYLLCFVQSGNYTKCLSEANVDKNKLNKCMDNLNKTYELYSKYPQFAIPEEDRLNEKYGVRGSPTIVINDRVVSLTRSPEAFKEAICNAFTNPPEECNTKLSTAQAAPGIGPLESSGNTESGIC